MADLHGGFVWYELLTTDMAAATAFYTQLMGWGAYDASLSGIRYHLFLDGDAPVAGVMNLPADAPGGATPRWIGYVGVDDVDAAAARTREFGGAVLNAPKEIPGASRFSIVADPQAATFGLFKWLNPDQQRPAEPGAPGRVGWHELVAANGETAFDFYRALLGWRKTDAGVGPAGPYQLFAAGGQTIGGMFNKAPSVPAPFWLYYLNVGDIDTAVKRVTAGGGQLVEGPFEVLGGAIARCADPQGAMFALEGRHGRGAIGYFTSTPRDPSGARGRRWNW
jgi:predicted enzyme related to lactoylglutathione lyase